MIYVVQGHKDTDFEQVITHLRTEEPQDSRGPQPRLGQPDSLARQLLSWFVPSAWIGEPESHTRPPGLLGWETCSKSLPGKLRTTHIFSWILKMPSPQKERGKYGTRSALSSRTLRASSQTCRRTRARGLRSEMYASDPPELTAPLEERGPRAIQNPNDIQLQEKAWNAVCPLVVRLKRFYEFSIRLEKALQSLLESLTCPPYTPTQHLEREQALAKEFAEILHFTLRFDELKMRNPAIQNDFSYYRRTISRNRINNMHLDIENEVNNEMANRMSLFYAEATPMLKTLSNATMHFVSENKTLPIENTTDCLSTMTSVCKVMLETPEYRSRFTSEETLMFCMRVMVGVIILYDHVHPVGAFCKTSKIDMKGCIKVLKEQAPDSVEGLLNALRFTTKHLNDESTSKQIRAMLQ
ncbi:CYFIP-related Rac1 interactor A isoform X1 [Manis pentadactyla]|uniref:CYFIP-related Rac1 interactor A isoform X1 n=2 Tax=Manis pentadactyla TaxID=143292 RepID=UPI00255D0683|nr:CYFIP-related Rac1 interactor A isoform X1 [Manis pentadactyla]